MERGHYTIIDDRPCYWPDDDLPAATVSDFKLDMVGPTKCSIDAVLVRKRHRLPHRSHKFNRARKGVC